MYPNSPNIEHFFFFVVFFVFVFQLNTGYYPTLSCFSAIRGYKLTCELQTLDTNKLLRSLSLFSSPFLSHRSINSSNNSNKQ